MMVADIDRTQKGQRYARAFRKAGTFIGKGDLARALEVLEQGRKLAQKEGDSAMARRFAEEILRLNSQRSEP